MEIILYIYLLNLVLSLAIVWYLFDFLFRSKNSLRGVHVYLFSAFIFVVLMQVAEVLGILNVVPSKLLVGILGTIFLALFLIGRHKFRKLAKDAPPPPKKK